MDFNSTIDLIVRELDEACEIIDDLKKSQDAPVIQIELAKLKCRNAAAAIGLLKSINKQDNADELTSKPKHHDSGVKKEIVSTEPDVEEKPLPGKPAAKKKEEEQAEKRPEKKISEKSPVEEEPFHLMKEPKNIEETDPDLVMTSENDQTEKKPYVSPIIADSFSHLASRFNEQVGREDDELSHIRKKHVSRLTDAIGVNDKFYFIREVFDGNKDAYSTAIAHLENIGNIQEAKEVIMNHRKHKTENEAVNELLELVKRKLTPDE
jgi:hypothetical protein